ncbi:hypothetical protein SUGI_0214040 [Cryptomeria japonica]|uniref:protein NRT1/ PTR FAMILY 5.10 n=1 Tax=Cryptomeria japonica TaxID=3369 RepID=UPI002408DC39|nr:protein NRT1/ PTR FAMILY 5.10 [Cryptomeria japonica]GLJ13509.1 hypothetical protein SUGI_0214040 [Cryptomeria japonica]
MEPISFSDSPAITHIAEDGSTDLRGRPVSRLLTGGWSASLLIIGVEMTERLAYFGVSGNLVIYLTNVMQQNTATAAKNVNVWYGVASMLPLLGAFLADSYFGRYWTILFSSLIYLLGLICLTLSASLPLLRPPPCDYTSYSCPRPAAFQVVFFFISLYLVALGQGGHRPCLQAFGADQFDERDPAERKNKSSFFNWWYFGLCSGLFVLVPVVVYIQENVGWSLGFALPAAAMAIALSLFLGGTKMYRHKIPSTSPVTQIVQVFVAAICKWNVSVHSQGEGKLYGIQGLKDEKRTLLPSNQFRFLDKATIATDLDHENKTNIDWRLCTATQVEQVKLVLRLIPIWVTCLVYGVICAQTPTFFTKQGSTMDRRIIGDFKIPSANMQSFISLTVLVLVPVYDRIFVPLARSITGNERGITLLQRIGVGMFISVISMIVAAMTEMKRLQAAREYGLIDMPQVTIPLSVWWLLPQYILFGISDVFTYLGLQEYFYDQMPDSMRSLGVALYLSIFGVGSFLSSILISIIEDLSSRVMGQNWFTDNLNRAHLDYFYWLLAALNSLFLCIYLSFARKFIYKEEESNVWKDEEIF